jgi:hypothetical protein
LKSTGRKLTPTEAHESKPEEHRKEQDDRQLSDEPSSRVAKAVTVPDIQLRSEFPGGTGHAEGWILSDQCGVRHLFMLPEGSPLACLAVDQGRHRSPNRRIEAAA